MIVIYFDVNSAVNLKNKKRLSDKHNMHLFVVYTFFI